MTKKIFNLINVTAFAVILALIVSLLPMDIFADSSFNMYEVNNFQDFKNAITSINASTSGAAEYTINLKNDIEFPSEASGGYIAKIQKNTLILGNGNKINLGDSKLGSYIHIEKNVTLSLGSRTKSENENKLTITSKDSVSRSISAIVVGNSSGDKSTGTLNMYSGVAISGIKADKNVDGSAINIANGQFNIYGGEISNNEITLDDNEVLPYKAGGAIFGDGSTSGTNVSLNIYGGSVHSNKIIQESAYNINGGGIYLNNATLYMEGGNISNNAIEHTTRKMDRYTRGGGIFIKDGRTTLKGGLISENLALQGGGIYVDKGSITIYDTKITSNSAKTSGGGIYNNGNLILKGGLISENKTIFDVADGGGITNTPEGTIVIEAGNIINNSTNTGGGIQNSGTLTIKGGKISNNTAKIGGGIYNSRGMNGSIVTAPGTIIMEDGEISANTTTRNGGGGIYSRGGIITIKKGSIINNKAAHGGGGIYVQAGNAILQDALITGNVAVGGAGLFNDDWATLTLDGARIYGNKAEIVGGGIYNTDATLKVLKGTAIVDNSAEKAGGGLFNKKAKAEIEKGAILANNTAKVAADDIINQEGGSPDNGIILADAKDMNTILTTDGSNHPITSWYNDNNPRWEKNSPTEVNISNKLTGNVYLKAAYKYDPSKPNNPNNPNPGRVDGPDRIETGINISKKYYDKAKTVILVRHDLFPDSMTASVLAKLKDAPILLNPTNKLDPRVAAEIKRLGAEEVIIVGGPDSISEKVRGDLKAYDKDKDVERIAGIDRYGTSEMVARRVVGITGKKYTGVVASGQVFPDALSVGTFASRDGYPILLVKKDMVPDQVERAIKDLEIKKTYIAGGTNTISRLTEAKLPSVVERMAGKDRYETSVAIAKSKFKDSRDAFIASGEEFADALVISPVSGKYNRPTLLASRNKNTNALVKKYISDTRILGITAIGGERYLPYSILLDLVGK
nr:cell wall-binding repeat-containing protein [uncultured Peptostreptococcus sp.]